MSNFEKFSTTENNEEAENKTKEEGSEVTEFDSEENKTEINENKSESANKSNVKGAKRSGIIAGALSALAFMTAGAKEAPQSAEDMFAAKEKNRTEETVKSGMEGEENAQEMSETNAKIIKALDVLSEDQLAELADSAGMISLSDLVTKIIRYSPGTYFINPNNISVEIQKQARMHRIEGTTQIIVCGPKRFLEVSRNVNDFGKTKDTYTKPDDVPEKISIDKLKHEVQLIFNSK